jgi:flavin reductase (DIM6/NTAB) family NADH-FMN oxidoreductase RutF
MKKDIFNTDLLRKAWRQWSSGVAIVTARHGERQHGMTVNTLVSLSLEPPLLMVSLAQDTRTHDLALASGYLGITILSRAQEDLSDRFAGRLPEQADRLQGLETSVLVSGAPLLPGGLAWFDCQVQQTLPVGTHRMFIAEILATRVFSGEPLCYHDGRYHRLIP